MPNSGRRADLIKLVSQNKITQDQENLILDKLQELRTNRQNWKNLTSDQRKTALQQEKMDLQSWAKQNNIDPKYLLFGHIGRMGGMRGAWGK